MRDKEIVGLYQAYLDVYSNLNYNQDIVEVATEYFYTYGLNEDGIDILIEKVGLDNFVEFVYDLSEDLTILTEARSAKRRTGSESYADVKAKIDAKEAAKKEAKAAALKRKESERVEPGADTESKKKQPKSKKPLRDALAKRILDGMERHRQATQTAGRLAGETGRTLGRIASLAGEAGRRGVEHVKTHGMKSLANSFDPFDTILEYLVAEGYADSYEEAEYIIEDMSDEEFELLNEARTQKPWSETKIKRFNKEIGRQEKQRKKTPHSSLRPADQAALRRMLAGDPAPEPISNEPSPSPTRSASKPGQKPRITFADMSNSSDQGRRPRKLNAGMEYDTFDAILEHLVAEGYADTNESALAIMANMSEEWRQSIVEAAADQSNKQIEKGVKTTYKAGNVLDNDRSRGVNRVHYADRDDKVKRMRGRLKARRSDLFRERNKREDESRAEIKRKYGI